MTEPKQAMALVFYSPRGLAREGITDPAAIDTALEAQGLQILRQMAEARFGFPIPPNAVDRLSTDEAWEYARRAPEIDRPTRIALSAGSLIPVLFRGTWLS